MQQTESTMAFLQSLKENELCELVLMPLFEALGYNNIRYVHGVLEQGKDIVFTQEDPLDKEIYCCAVVKAVKLSGSVSRPNGIHEVYFQITQAVSEPYTDPFKGSQVTIDKVYVVTPYAISNQTILSIKSLLQQRENRVAFIDGPHLVTLIKKSIPNLLISLPDPNIRYLDMLIRRLREAGTSFSKSQNRTITDLYTPARLSDTTIEKARLISFAHPSLSNETYGSEELLVKGASFVILADVGAGKTTLLQNLAIIIASHSISDALNKNAFIPIFVSLHLLPLSIYVSLSSFDDAIRDYLKRRHAYCGYLENEFSRYVLFLDGFDEVASMHNEMEGILRQLPGRYGGGVYLTSRASRIPILGDDFKYVRLEPFTDNDIIQFLSKWFEDQPGLAVDLWERIRNEITLLSFCRTPLMLTLYALLADRIPLNFLPVRRTDIYRMISDQLIGNWDDMRRIRTFHDKAEKEFVLERIALACHKKNARTFSKWELLDAYRKLGVNSSNPDSEDSFLNELIFRSSLIRFAEEDKLEFVHLSFQEYFVAKSLVRIGNQKLLKSQLFDNWYRGVWVFYFGIKRSMEEISTISAKIFHCYGLRLMEYLLEADYTPAQIKNQFFNYASHDILDKASLSDAELFACSQIGVSLLYGLKEVIRESEGRKKPRNLFKIAVHLDTDKSRLFVLESQDLLGSLSLKDQEFMVEKIPIWVNNKEWTKYFNALCVAIENNVEWTRLERRESEERLRFLENCAMVLYGRIKDKVVNKEYLVNVHRKLTETIRIIKKTKFSL
ncbi:MAG: NACHT domain-containing protein [Proteobacteria bacterium]|nr:NACHT domain-containing protein [Pseudomonadota bacterium]